MVNNPKEYAREYRKRNLEKIRKRDRERYLRDHEKRLANSKRDYQRHKEQRKSYHKEYYQKNKEEFYERALRLKYGEVRFQVLKRDNMTCQNPKCKKILGKHHLHISIHHIDWDESNNNLENLVLLCNPCHTEIHSKTRCNYSIPQKFIIDIFCMWIKGEKIF